MGTVIMKHLLSASVIAIATATAASAVPIFPGPGTVDLFDADVGTTFIDFFGVAASSTETWTFNNLSSGELKFTSFLGNALSPDEGTLASLLVGYTVPTVSPAMPFSQNGNNVSGDFTLANITIPFGGSIDLIFDATGISNQISWSFAFDIEAVPVPLPATLPLAAAGLGVLALYRRKAKTA